jgi:hypothetical protein
MTVSPLYFLLRMRRDGPLVPAKIWLCDHDPADPSNTLDRGRLSIFPRALVAGREVPPERVLERIGIYGRRRGDGTLMPGEAAAALADPALRAPRPVGHWAYPQPITAAEYNWRVAHLDWTREHRPEDPRAHPHRPVKPAELPLPNFDRENASVG